MVHAVYESRGEETGLQQNGLFQRKGIRTILIHRAIIYKSTTTCNMKRKFFPPKIIPKKRNNKNDKNTQNQIWSALYE